MATIRLVPSQYSVNNSSYVTVTDPTNMYYNVDHTANYASLRGRQGRSNNSTYYAFIHGFNISAVPSNATVSSFKVKIKAYRNSYMATGSTTYRICLSSQPSNVYRMDDTRLSSDITTTSGGTIYEIPIGSLTWDDIKEYGSYFSIQVPLKNTSTSSSIYPYVYVYGAEIEVTYTVESIAVTGVSLNKNSTSISIGNTEQLIATVTPSNATNQAVSWSSSNTSVATVSSTGLVTGVSAGTATITVTTSDGNKTATCAVTVTQPVLKTYKLATSVAPGKSYLIANGNSGSVYLLSNEANGSRKLKGVSATVTNSKISISSTVEAKTLFSVNLTVSGNSVTTGWSINGQYLYSDNASGLRMNTVSTLDRFWHWNNNKFWQFKSTSSDGYTDTSSEYKYYLTLSGTDFTDNHVSTTSIESSNIPSIYLFEEDTGSTDTVYVKINGSWVQASTVYKKINGSWVEQTDLTNVFDSGTNYKVGS